MDIDAAQHRGIEEALGQDVAVGHDHGGIEIERLEGLCLLVTPQTLGRAHGEAEREGELVDRRPPLLLTTAGRFGRAGIDRDHVVAGIGQRLECRYGEIGSAEKRNLHRRIL